MGGGPGGSGAGVDSKSLFWAIVMSAFAGAYLAICLYNLASNTTYLLAFGGILFGWVVSSSQHFMSSFVQQL